MWDLVHLSLTLKANTPRGKKDRKWIWAESPVLIRQRLETFLKYYPEVQEKYTEQDVIDAYDRYLKDTTNPDGSISSFRRLLKYFIFKKEDELTSDLINYLDLKDELDENTVTSSGDTSWNDLLI